MPLLGLAEISEKDVSCSRPISQFVILGCAGYASHHKF